MSGGRFRVIGGRISAGFECRCNRLHGTRTTAPIAPNQNPHKCRSYESIVRTSGITGELTMKAMNIL